MRYHYTESNTGADFRLSLEEPEFNRRYFQEKEDQLLAIAWNRGEDQNAYIDEVEMHFPNNSFISLTAQQTFEFQRSEDVVIWQYNREFYCILDHDKEVSCVGFLFYGGHGTMLIQPNAAEARKFGLLLEVFKDEFQTRDNIQGEMLRMLLKRLIIKLTRLGKAQHLNTAISENDFDLLRKFNVLVEGHFKQYHQVQDYANLLHKSPKTLSNLFHKNQEKSPLQIIQERIALEGKRLLVYTDLSASEIGYELGFEEPAHFSRFFKKMTGHSPTKFKQELKKSLA